MEITVKQYMERQPGNPKVQETDQFYLWIALRLAKLWDESPGCVAWPMTSDVTWCSP